jgi:hypothetical protein
VNWIELVQDRNKYWADVLSAGLDTDIDQVTTRLSKFRVYLGCHWRQFNIHYDNTVIDRFR